MSKLTGIAKEIWEKKYKFKGNVSCKEDKTIQDTWRRVAKGISINEKDSTHWEKQFYSILEGFKFLPGGRITANTGTGQTSVTSLNCFVSDTIEDSMDKIFDMVKYSALTQKAGGGIGYDFSDIRPEGDIIKGCGAPASGPISFMHVFDTTAKTIMSSGIRRSAQLACLRCDHPDIEKYIEVKHDGKSLKMFNLSIGITDTFIESVLNDSDWDLVFKGKTYRTIKAKYLFDKIMKSTYNHAEPGVLFLDTINKMNNLKDIEVIKSANPCKFVHCKA